MHCYTLHLHWRLSNGMGHILECAALNDRMRFQKENQSGETGPNKGDQETSPRSKSSRCTMLCRVLSGNWPPFCLAFCKTEY